MLVKFVKTGNFHIAQKRKFSCCFDNSIIHFKEATMKVIIIPLLIHIFWLQPDGRPPRLAMEREPLLQKAAFTKALQKKTNHETKK